MTAYTDPLTVRPHVASAIFDAFPEPQAPLPGFEPLRVEAGPPLAVRCWNRRYALDAAGLLAAVRSGDRDVLAGPVRLVGHVDGAALAPAGDSQQVAEAAARRVVVASAGAQGALRATTRTTVEEDGLARFEVDLDAGAEAEWRDVTLEVPLRAAHVRYVDYEGDFPFSNCGTRKLPGTQGPLWTSAQALDYERGEADAAFTMLTNTFLPYLWLGDDRGGLAFAAESDAGWQDAPGRSILTVDREGDAVVLRVHVIMGTVRRRSLHLDVCLQATPVKALPPGWRGWDFASIAALGSPAPAAATRRTTFAGMGLVGDVRYQHSRHPFLPEALRADVERVHAAGRSYVTYLCVNLLSEAHPGLTRDQIEDMAKVPRVSRPWPPSPEPVQHHKVCNGSPANLAMVLQTVDDLVGSYGLDGIYLDNAALITGCLRAGCAYDRPDGSRQPIFPHHLSRAFYARLAAVFQRHGKEPFIWVHSSRTALIPWFSRATCMMDGELLVASGFVKDHLDMVDEAAGAVRLGPHALGLPMLSYSDLKYANGYRRRHPDPVLDEAAFVRRYGDAHIASVILHDSLFAGIRDSDYHRPVTDALAAFGIAAADVTFHPYWGPGAVGADVDRVRVSVYRRPAAALLALGNGGDEAAAVTLRLAGSVCDGVTALRDALSGEAVAVDGGTARLTVPARGYRVLTGVVG